MRSAFALAHALESSGALSARWEQAGVDVGYALPALVGCCLAAAVLGYLRLSLYLGGVAGAAVVTASIAAIVELGASVDAGPWFGVFGSAAALTVAVAATFR